MNVRPGLTNSICSTKLDCMRQTTIKVCIAIQRWRPDWACWRGTRSGIRMANLAAVESSHRRIPCLAGPEWNALARIQSHSAGTSEQMASESSYCHQRFQDPSVRHLLRGIASIPSGLDERVCVPLQLPIPWTSVVGLIVASCRWSCADSSFFNSV